MAAYNRLRKVLPESRSFKGTDGRPATEQPDGLIQQSCARLLQKETLPRKLVRLEVTFHSQSSNKLPSNKSQPQQNRFHNALLPHRLSNQSPTTILPSRPHIRESSAISLPSFRQTSPSRTSILTPHSLPRANPPQRPLQLHPGTKPLRPSLASSRTVAPTAERIDHGSEHASTRCRTAASGDDGSN